MRLRQMTDELSYREFTMMSNSPLLLTCARRGAILSGLLGVALLAPSSAPAQAVKSILLRPASFTGGANVTGTVTLDKIAGSGGLVVTLGTNASFATVPGSVTVPANATSVQFTFPTKPVLLAATAQVTATGGGKSASTMMGVSPPMPKTIELTPARVVGGQAFSGKVTLTGRAPEGGIDVKLTDASRSVGLTGLAHVAAGQAYVNFPGTTSAVASDTVSGIDATCGGGQISTDITVLAPTGTLGISPSTVKAGVSSTGKVTLSSPAPAGGIKIALSSNSAVATVPANVTVAAGTTSKNFTITTSAGGATATVAATLNGQSSKATLTVKAATGLADSPWPKLKGNILGTGLALGKGAKGTKLWSFGTSGNPAFATPSMGEEGTLYFGSDDGYVRALTPTGTQKWAYQTGGAIGSTPVVAADGTIYIGSNDESLHALKPDGTQKWQFATGLNILTGPTVAVDGTVYVSSADGKLYALNPNGTQKWAFAAQANIYSSPAIAPDGTIYVGSEDNYVYGVNPNGTQKWRFKTGHVVRSSPAVASDGTIYVGCWDTYLYALNPNGTLKWRFQTGATIAFSSPTIGPDGTVYIGSWDNHLYALTPAGAQKWSFAATAGISTSAVGADGVIYAGCDDHYLYALNPNGTVKWKYLTGGSPSGPAIAANGTLFFGDSDGLFYAVK